MLLRDCVQDFVLVPIVLFFKPHSYCIGIGHLFFVQVLRQNPITCGFQQRVHALIFIQAQQFTQDMGLNSDVGHIFECLFIGLILYILSFCPFKMIKSYLNRIGKIKAIITGV